MVSLSLRLGDYENDFVEGELGRNFEEARMKPFTKHCKLWKFKITLDHQTPSSIWGRFGGGWNWMLGIRVGGHTLMIHLLILSIRIEYVPQPI